MNNVMMTDAQMVPVEADLLSALKDMSLFMIEVTEQLEPTMSMVLLHLCTTLPVSVHDDNAGYDVTMPNMVILKSRAMTKVPLGIAVEAPVGMLISIEG
ncbi:hypothetical protein EV175_005944, partial [Coemansia sp. RSA 1933]